MPICRGGVAVGWSSNLRHTTIRRRMLIMSQKSGSGDEWVAFLFDLSDLRAVSEASLPAKRQPLRPVGKCSETQGSSVSREGGLGCEVHTHPSALMLEIALRLSLCCCHSHRSPVADRPLKLRAFALRAMPFHMADESDSDSASRVEVMQAAPVGPPPAELSFQSDHPVEQEGQSQRQAEGEDAGEMTGIFEHGTAEQEALAKARRKLDSAKATKLEKAPDAASDADGSPTRPPRKAAATKSKAKAKPARPMKKPAAATPEAESADAAVTEKKVQGSSGHSSAKPEASKKLKKSTCKATGVTASTQNRYDGEAGINKCFASRPRPDGGKRLQLFNEIEDGYYELVRSGVKRTKQTAYWTFFTKEMAALPTSMTPQQRCKAINEKYKAAHPENPAACSKKARLEATQPSSQLGLNLEGEEDADGKLALEEAQEAQAEDAESEADKSVDQPVDDEPDDPDEPNDELQPDDKPDLPDEPDVPDDINEPSHVPEITPATLAAACGPEGLWPQPASPVVDHDSRNRANSGNNDHSDSGNIDHSGNSEHHSADGDGDSQVPVKRPAACFFVD